jgi:LysR family transcriptional regulator, transcriptional activator of nhaA
VLRASPSGRPRQLRVGLADVLPKSIAHHLLAPAMALNEPVHLVCREDKLPHLLAELAIHRLDLVLADSPMPADAEVKGYSHKLGECGISLLARPELAAGLTGDFPACLEGAPLLIPGEGTSMRGRLLRWLAEQNLHPRIVGEFDDSALMRAFGQGGSGIFPAPATIAGQIRQQDGLVSLGEIDAVQEHFYAISVERRVSHPAVLAILQAASDERSTPRD